MEWSQTYPGLPTMASAVRAFVRALLINSPRLADAELVVTELVTNSLRYTPSGRHGGEFSVVVALRPGWARVAVSDAGSSGWCRPGVPPAHTAEYGRGLLIAEWCADKIGHDGTPHGQTVWAEFAWDPGL